MDRLALGILAHVDAGKTTLSEAILYLTGKIRNLGRVDHKDTFLDTFAMERERGITIFSKQALFPLGDREITLVDTPGHEDFSAEMERTLQILDYAVLVISGADGVQGHTQTLWRLLKSYHIPVFLFVNKMDQAGTDQEKLMDELKHRLDDNCICFSDRESDEEFQEELAMCDERVMEHYLEEGEVSEEQIIRLIEERKVFPCYFGSALKLLKVDAFIEDLNRFMRQPYYTDTFSAKAYKITRDEQGNRLTWMKISGGSLRVKTLLEEEKIDQIRIYSGPKFQLTEEATAGTLCAVTGMQNSYAGQGFGEQKDIFAPMLEPVLNYQILLPPGADVPVVLKQLRQLEEEDPLLHITWNKQFGEIHVHLMGEVQKDVIVKMMEERFGLPISLGPGHIQYKETITAPVIGVGHYEPLRHYAEVHLLLEPGEPGSGLVFATDCSEDVLARNWQRLILTHMKEKEHVGVLAGAPITDMRITLVAGRAHQKHTEGGDFRQATYRAIRHGLRCGSSILLEPWYRFSLELPAENVGRAMSDIQKMNGSFSSPMMEDDIAILSGDVPASEIVDYPSVLHTYTSGRGRLSLVLKGYEPCHNSDEVLAELAYDCEQDLDNPMGSVFCSHGAGYYVPWYQVRDYMHIKDDTRSLETGESHIDLFDDALWAYDDAYSDDYDESDIPDAEPGRTSGNGRKTKKKFSAYGDDAELEAIMEREFGAKTKEKDKYRNFKKSNAGKRVGPRPVSTPKPSTVKIDRNTYLNAVKKSREKEYLLVDGYNIIFAWEELSKLSEANLDAARMKLMDILSNYQGYVGCTLILVFDAYRVKGNVGAIYKYHNIHVVFTKEAETADQYIEKTTHEIARKYHVTVATSDSTEQVIVMGQGADKIAALDFEEEVLYVEKQIREDSQAKKENSKNYLFEGMEEETAELLEEVRLGRKTLE